MTEATEEISKLTVLSKLKALILSVFLPLGVFILSQILAAIILSPVIPGLFDDTKTTTIAQNFAYVVFFELLALALIWGYMKWRKHGLDWIGFGSKPKLRDMALVIPVAGVYIVVSVVSFVVIEMLQTGVDLNQAQNVGFESASGTLQVALAFVSLVVMTPLAEEVLMRGIMFRNINRTFGFVVAALISAAIFGILHGQVNLFIDTFVLGLALAWLVNKTNSLWPAIGLHMLKNFIAFLYLFVF